MGNKVIFFTMFITGIFVGAAVTWQRTKRKYEQLAQDEIDSVKEVFSKREIHTEENLKKADYANIINELDYAVSNEANDSNTYNSTESIPYVITPDEFGERDDYEKIGITYFSDGVLVDDYDEVIENADDAIGLESLNHFGEYEDDSVFVRNDRLKCDYEILLDQRKYSDVVKKE